MVTLVPKRWPACFGNGVWLFHPVPAPLYPDKLLRVRPVAFGMLGKKGLTRDVVKFGTCSL